MSPWQPGEPAVAPALGAVSLFPERARVRLHEADGRPAVGDVPPADGEQQVFPVDWDSLRRLFVSVFLAAFQTLTWLLWTNNLAMNEDNDIF